WGATSRSAPTRSRIILAGPAQTGPPCARARCQSAASHGVSCEARPLLCGNAMRTFPRLGHTAFAFLVLSAAVFGCANSNGGASDHVGPGCDGGAPGNGGDTSATGGTGGNTSATGGNGGAAAAGLKGAGGSVVLEGTSIVLIGDNVGTNGGRLVRMDIASGEVTTLFQGSWPHQWVGDALAADATNYYFTISDLGPSRIVALPRTGGTPVPLTPPGDYGWLATNASNIYWITEQGIMTV